MNNSQLSLIWLFFLTSLIETLPSLSKTVKPTSQCWWLSPYFLPSAPWPKPYSLLLRQEYSDVWAPLALAHHTAAWVMMLKYRSGHLAPMLRVFQGLSISLIVQSKVRIILYKTLNLPSDPHLLFLWSHLLLLSSATFLQPSWASCQCWNNDPFVGFCHRPLTLAVSPAEKALPHILAWFPLVSSWSACSNVTFSEKASLATLYSDKSCFTPSFPFFMPCRPSPPPMPVDVYVRVCLAIVALSNRAFHRHGNVSCLRFK